MSQLARPIFCLADSQLLFWKRPETGQRVLTDMIADPRAAGPLRAAYIGASNGDDEVFYQLFQAAAFEAGIEDVQAVHSSYGSTDREVLASADVILLAGGDPSAGFDIFEKTGLDRDLTRRYGEGAILIGVSAGAQQLGWSFGGSQRKMRSGLRLVPAIVDVHDEENDWRRLEGWMRGSDLEVRGLGIPTGGGFALHPDYVVEPIRSPITEIIADEGELHRSLLFPGVLEPTSIAESEPN